MLLTRPTPIFPIVKSQKGRSHWYEINGKKVPGVTFIIDLYPKPGLIQGSANAVIRSVKEKVIGFIQSEWKNGSNFDAAVEDRIYIILEECRTAYAKEWRGEADYGTRVHDLIHQFIEKDIVELKDEHEKVRSGFQAFLNWFYANKVTFVASELIVGSKIHGFCGTLDALAYVNGKFCILDWKTNKAITPSMFQQVQGGYKIAFEESYDYFPKVDECWILRCPKDGSEFEIKKIPTDPDVDKAAFLYALGYKKLLPIYEQYDPYVRKNA